MSEKFLFKWNNHVKVMDEFKNFLSFGIMVDVTLACDKQSLKAHKIILSACSSFFRSLFLENPCKHPIVIMKDIKYTELKAIIDFMYCGEVDVPENQVSALVKAAQTLGVKGLGEVESLDDQSGNESHNSSDDEFEDLSAKEPETEPENQSVIGQNDNGEFALETVIMEDFQIKQEVYDDVQDNISQSNSSTVLLERPNVNFPTSKLKQLLEKGSILEENFLDFTPNLERRIFATDNLPEPSIQSPTEVNKELHQNHSEKSASLVSGTLTSASSPSDAIVTENQQPSTSSASGKRPSKKSVHQPLQKKAKIVRNSSQKSVKQLRNLRKPEVVIINDSNSIKKNNKITNSENNKITNSDNNKITNSKSAKNKMKLYECRICPFKTVCRKSLKMHMNSRHPETKWLKCTQCSFVASGKYRLERHVAVHQVERPYHCSLCTYKFKHSHELKKHVKKIHKLEKLIFKCKECHFSAAEQESIKKHVIDIHEKIPSIVIDKLPEVIQKSPEVINKLPEVTEQGSIKKHMIDIHKKIPSIVINKLPEGIDNLPEVVDKLPEVTEQGSIKKHMIDIHEKIPSIVISKLPEVIDNLPEVIDKLPEVTEQGSKKKHMIDIHEKIPTIVINKLPEVTDKLPEVIEKLPESIDKLPKVIIKLPDSIDKLPEIVNKLPEGINKLPEEMQRDI